MSRKKISTTIYVTPEQNDRLKLLHERTKVPVAVYIREGIDLVLNHYAHLLPGQLALDVTPPPPLGEALAALRRREEEEESPLAPRVTDSYDSQTQTPSVAASGKK
jgi:predicted DNA-binding protein